MRHRFILTFMAVVSLLIVGCGGRGELTRGALMALQHEPMPPFTPPQVREVELSNGARVFLLEDHELPVVNMSVIVRGGSIYEPSRKLGVAALTAMMLRDGGTPSRTPDEVDRIIDDAAARVSFTSGREMIEGSLKVLSTEFDSMLEVFLDLLFRSRRDEARLEINRLALIGQIKREEDDPETLAERDFPKLVYGDASPWARTPAPADVKRIGMADINAHAARFVRPNNSLIAVAGDIDADALIPRLEKMLCDLSADAVAFPSIPPVEREFIAGERYIPRDLNQAYIYLGHLGIKRQNPDKYALQVMNTVLGGESFTSRLGEDIRTRRGLAYSVWSYFGWGTDYGLFRVYAATKADNEDEVISLIKDKISTLARTGTVSEDEYRLAKDVVLNGLIFEFDNSFRIALSQARYRFFGYPPNYWEVYRDGIRKVTRKDVRRVSRTYLHPDALKLLVVGPRKVSP